MTAGGSWKSCWPVAQLRNCRPRSCACSPGGTTFGAITRSHLRQPGRLGIAREPRSAEWLTLAQQYAWNAFVNDVPRLLTVCDASITAGIGPAAFWHLLKADRFIDTATGESELEDFEWSPGHAILHPEFLRLAAESLEAALACEPGLWDRDEDRSWVGDWSMRFAAVLHEPAFRHLKQPRRTNS
jgi:hypothetical protein